MTTKEKMGGSIHMKVDQALHPVALVVVVVVVVGGGGGGGGGDDDSRSV